MSLRARIFIIISVVVLLVLSISIFLVVRGKDSNNQATPNNMSDASNSGQNNSSGSVADSGTEVPSGVPVRARTPLEVEQSGVEQLAKVFIERYGTYSTDNEFANIKEAEPLVTKLLWSKISLGIGAASQGSGFTGLTTKAVSATLVSWTDASAVFDIRVLRNENKNGTVSNRNQTVTVEMVKSGNSWLANSLVWK